MNYQEYYCPHCGAILNEQLGFDPDKGIWICAECGQMLMDDDINNGTSFEGVAWFCDNCGALLNRQDGFSDSYGTWKCTECGHINGTTEDDIINGFKCPRCGATLELQSDFNKYDDEWICSKCGAHLHHSYSDDEYEEVEEPKHRCPNCNAALDKQWGYSEHQDNWICTECGVHLHHSYNDEDYTVIRYTCPNCESPLDIQWNFSEYDDNWECTECGVKLHHDYLLDEYTAVQEKSDEDNEDAKKNNAQRFQFAYGYSAKQNNGSSSNSNSYRTYEAHPKKKNSNRIGIIIALLLLFVGVTGYMGYNYVVNLFDTASHPGEIKLAYSANTYKGTNYYNAIIKLAKQGLSDIRLTSLNDLKSGIFSGDTANVGIIENIEINGTSDFMAGSWVDEKSVVSIKYHSVRKTEKNGYETNTNGHLFINGVDIVLPSYFIEDTKDALIAIYHVKGEKKARLIINADNNEEWTELNKYDTHFVLIQKERFLSGLSGEDMVALGEMTNEVYSINVVTLRTEKEPGFLHIAMVSPDNSETDYTSDYEKILSDIYVPKDSEIRIDFTIADYKGKDFNYVVDELKSKGFQNIKTDNLRDVVIGIFEKDGAVERISINGNVDYSIGNWISNESEIVITYHGKK